MVFEYLDTDGTTTVISPSTRYMVRMTDATSISLSAGSSTLISCDMTGLTTSNSDIIFEQFAQAAVCTRYKRVKRV